MKTKIEIYDSLGKCISKGETDNIGRICLNPSIQCNDSDIFEFRYTIEYDENK